MSQNKQTQSTELAKKSKRDAITTRLNNRRSNIKSVFSLVESGRRSTILFQIKEVKIGWRQRNFAAAQKSERIAKILLNNNS